MSAKKDKGLTKIEEWEYKTAAKHQSLLNFLQLHDQTFKGKLNESFGILQVQ